MLRALITASGLGDLRLRLQPARTPHRQAPGPRRRGAERRLSAAARGDRGRPRTARRRRLRLARRSLGLDRGALGVAAGRLGEAAGGLLLPSAEHVVAPGRLAPVPPRHWYPNNIDALSPEQAQKACAAPLSCGRPAQKYAPKKP